MELGKVQVYQEPNRGELSLTRAMLICVRNVTYWLSPPSSTPATARLSGQLGPLAGSQAGKLGESGV